MMHRDLKSENIFLKDSVAKIGDFGFSSHKTITNSIIGSPIYQNPKQVKAFASGKSKNYDKNIDAWSLGVILY